MTEDSLTRLIVDRLGERQRKLDRMAEWAEWSKTRRVRLTYWGTAVAACVAVFLIVFPMERSALSPLDELKLDYNLSENFRSASPETERIESLISERDYAKALRIVQSELYASDKSARETYSRWKDAKGESGTEEYEYDYRVSMLHNSELRWLYIWLLVRTEDFHKAVEQLEIYLHHKEFCANPRDAQMLLETIKDR